MKGICINANTSTELKVNQEYYLFPAKPNHYYVSRFNNKSASFGCYQVERFQIMEEEKWPQEPRGNIPLLDPCTFYHANLIWRKQGYKNKMLKRYVVQSKGTHCMFWHDEKRKKPCGCFPAHWFAEFKELKEDEETQQQEFLPFLERADGQLTFFLNLNFVIKRIEVSLKI